MSARDANMVSTSMSNAFSDVKLNQLATEINSTRNKWNPDSNYKKFNRVSLERKLEYESLTSMKGRLINSTKNSEMKTIIKQLKSRN